MLTLAVAMAIGAYLLTKPTTQRLVETGGAEVCQSRYCGPREMFVDIPMNTLLKDQSLGTGLSRPRSLPGPTEVFAKIQNDLAREQLLSPGVRLVAHAVA